MVNVITPAFRSFFTDMFGGLMNFQEHPFCANHELRVVDCLEAYGIHHGKKKCRLLLDDFRECVTSGKQLKRVEIMRNERLRQIRDGERSAEEAFAPPPRLDSY